MQAVQQLLQEKIDVDEPTLLDDDRELTPLFLAASAGHADVVQTLLEAGAAVDAACFHPHGWRASRQTPLMGAAQNGHAEAVRRLLAAGAPVGTLGPGTPSPLLLATQGGHTEVARVLIKAGADVEDRDMEGNTVLGLATEPGHEDLYALMLEEGVSEERLQTVALCWAARKGNVQKLRQMIAEGADVNRGDDGGMTALIHAAHAGQLEAVQVLIEAGSNVSKSAHGFTALKFASQLAHEPGYQRICDLLREAEATN